MRQQLQQLVSASKNYRGYDLHLNIVSKVFNNGAGALALFRFFPEQKVIVINRLLATERDEKNLRSFCQQQGIEYKLLYMELGYPDYYFKTLNINDAS